MLASIDDLHARTLGGVTYWFRTPDCYDLPRIRRMLTKQGVRRPDRTEMRICAQLGVRRLAESGEWPDGEADRQVDMIDRWYKLLRPLDENDLDEPDQEKRAAQLAALQAERQKDMAALWPEISGIEAMLDRHWPAWSDLRADSQYWDEISRIDTVRVLIARIDDKPVPRDPDGLMRSEAYLDIPAEHRVPLATFAMGLLTPTESQRKN